MIPFLNIERVTEYFDSVMRSLLLYFPQKIAVAVSGGPDSMALIFLLEAWAKNYGVQLCAAVVDHQLRPESHLEAQTVCDWLRYRNIETHVLVWSPPSSGNMMHMARYGRYKAIATLCHEHGIKFMAVAHHADDAHETAHMYGNLFTPCMSAYSSLYGVTIIRPLLGLYKNDLLQIVTSHNHPWISDPSNTQSPFLRTKIRHMLARTTAEEKMNAMACIVRATDEKKKAYEVEFPHATADHNQGLLKISSWNPHLISQAQGIILLRTWIGFFRVYTLKHYALENFWEKIKHMPLFPKSLTLGGCLFVHHEHTLYIMREKGRGLPNFVHDGIWDDRFFCSTNTTLVPIHTHNMPPWIQRYAQSTHPLKPWIHHGCGTPMPCYKEVFSLSPHAHLHHKTDVV